MFISQQVSDQGKALAGDEPFIIRTGRARELVVTKPEHIYDFYKGDTKRMPPLAPGTPKKLPWIGKGTNTGLADHPKPPYLNMGKYFSG